MTDFTAFPIPTRVLAPHTNWLVVKTVDDLPDPVGDQCTLPADTTVLIDGAINLGSDALRVSSGTLLRGMGGDSIMSTNASGMLRGTNLASAVVLREFSLISLGGPALDLEGTLDHQLNMFFVGVFGAEAGFVTGFDVQGIKGCFFNCAAGLTLAGTTNKVYLEGNPFYGITPGNAAVRFAASLNCAVADIVTNFFKFESGTCFDAIAGYTVGEGKLRGNLIKGAATTLAGLAPSDVNWIMHDNTGIRDSRTAAQAYLTEPATTVVSVQGTYVPVVGGFTLTALSERFEKNVMDEIVYTGTVPCLVSFKAIFTVNPSSNDQLAFKATKNGVPLDESLGLLEQGQGAGTTPRTGACLALIEVVTGTRIGLAVANLTSSSDVPWLTATYTAEAG